MHCSCNIANECYLAKIACFVPQIEIWSDTTKKQGRKQKTLKFGIYNILLRAFLGLESRLLTFLDTIEYPR